MCVLLMLSSCNGKVAQDDDNMHSQHANIVEIYLIDSLDEPRGFCLDIKGYKESADIKKGLQAHTCYSYQGSIAVDQGFSVEHINIGEFYLPKDLPSNGGFLILRPENIQIGKDDKNINTMKVKVIEKIFLGKQTTTDTMKKDDITVRPVRTNNAD